MIGHSLSAFSQVTPLLLKRKPVPVKILYNDTAQVEFLDGSKKVQEYLTQLAAKVGVAEQARDYGLLLARPGMPAVWLQGGNFVDDYRLTERDHLRFCLMPRPILVELPSGERVSSVLDFQGEVVGQVMALVPGEKKCSFPFGIVVVVSLMTCFDRYDLCQRGGASSELFTRVAATAERTGAGVAGREGAGGHSRGGC